MKTKLFMLIACAMVCATGHAQSVIIDSLDSNGNLAATVPSNSVYTIEWTGALSPSNVWKNSWVQHRDVTSTNGSIDVEVPMFFRLNCWTNGLFLDAPVGRTFHYSVSNQFDFVQQVWMQEVEVITDALIPNTDHSYRVIRVEEFYDDSDFPPFGAQSRGISFVRMEEDSSYQYDQHDQAEEMTLQNGPVGTTWSYYSSDAETTNDVEIVSIEDVTIVTTNGPVTYTDCLKVETTGRPNGFNWQTNFSNRVYTEWIKPGGYIVKRENYWIPDAYSVSAPVIYELQGWTDK